MAEVSARSLRCGVRHPHEEADGRGLARAVRSDQGEHLVRLIRHVRGPVRPPPFVRSCTRARRSRCALRGMVTLACPITVHAASTGMPGLKTESGLGDFDLHRKDELHPFVLCLDVARGELRNRGDLCHRTGEVLPGYGVDGNTRLLPQTDVSQVGLRHVDRQLHRGEVRDHVQPGIRAGQLALLDELLRDDPVRRGAHGAVLDCLLQQPDGVHGLVRPGQRLP